MEQNFDEAGDIEYAVHCTLPKQVSSRRDDSFKTTAVSSTPKEDA